MSALPTSARFDLAMVEGRVTFTLTLTFNLGPVPSGFSERSRARSL